MEAIQPEGHQVPIIGVHVLGADQRFYRPLAERLGSDQPVFGVWTAAEPPARPSHFDVVEIARSYADEVDRRFPTGPVTLAAVSLGSVVAFDLAHQLLDRGRKVALLALFDALGPNVDAVALSPSERLDIHRRELGKGTAAYAEGRARMVRAHALRHIDRANLKARRKLGATVGGELLKRRFQEGNVALQQVYDYLPYPGRVLIFKGGDDAFTLPFAERGMGWEGLVTGSLEVSVVPGGHLSLLAEPNVEQLADELASAHADAVRALAE